MSPHTCVAQSVFAMVFQGLELKRRIERLGKSFGAHFFEYNENTVEQVCTTVS